MSGTLRPREHVRSAASGKTPHTRKRAPHTRQTGCRRTGAADADLILDGGAAWHSNEKATLAAAQLGAIPIGAKPIWISVKAAAERADLSRRTIKRWIANGWLQAIRLPSPKGLGQLRVRLGDVEALMARGALN